MATPSTPPAVSTPTPKPGWPRSAPQSPQAALKRNIEGLWKQTAYVTSEVRLKKMRQFLREAEKRSAEQKYSEAFDAYYQAKRELIMARRHRQTGDLLSEKDVKKERVCPHCGEQQLKINFEKPTTFSEVVVEDGKKVEHKLTPADIRARMEKIPNEDLIPLGINPDVARPEWTILTVLPVPPVTMRPSIILENGQLSIGNADDDAPRHARHLRHRG